MNQKNTIAMSLVTEIIVVALVVIASIAIAMIIGSMNSNHVSSTSTQRSIASGVVPIEGYDFVGGNGTASDGRVSITVNGYRIVNASTIAWVNEPCCPSPSVRASLLMVDATIKNIGSGNTSVSPFFSYWENKTTGQITYADIGPHNASFPAGDSPNMTFPTYLSGSVAPALGPKQSLRMWLFFQIYLPGPQQPTVKAMNSTLKFVGLMYLEHEYGGDILQNRVLSCHPNPCQQLSTELFAFYI